MLTILSHSNLNLLFHAHLSESKFYYGLRIANGTLGGSGTDDTGVHALLVGTSGATTKLYILGFFDKLKGGTCEDLIVEADSNLGDVQVVIFGNDKDWFHFTNDKWFVNYSIIYNLNGVDIASVRFPCYHWIGDSDSVSTTSATCNLSIAIAVTGKLLKLN